MGCCASSPGDDGEHLELTMSGELGEGDVVDAESEYMRLLRGRPAVPMISPASVGVAQDMNEQYRPEMQDVILAEPAVGASGARALCGVFDGHGGSRASVLAAEYVRNSVEAGLGTRDPKELLEDAFIGSDAMFEAENVLYEGTTAMVVVLESLAETRLLHLASVGDSRAVLSVHGRALDLAPLHVPANEDEIARVQREGGFLARGKVNGMVAVTRSLGDMVMKAIITSTPFTRTEFLTDENEYLVIACDGVWDVLHPQVAIDTCIRTDSPQAAADAILKSALDLGSTDNLSVIVIHLQQP